MGRRAMTGIRFATTTMRPQPTTSEVSAQASIVAEAITPSRSSTWTTQSLRSASQERMIFDRLLPKGYTRESFAGKTAHPLDAARVEVLKQFVEESRKKLDVPGGRGRAYRSRQGGFRGRLWRPRAG
jgi:hypothetical protein